MNVDLTSTLTGAVEVTASFERAAPAYRRHAQVQTAMADWLAEWLPARRDGDALEIGAGPGVFTSRILPWTGTMLATDVSPAMCAAGRLALPQVEWHVSSAEDPRGGPWNWIFCSSMLQWASQPPGIFAKWREVLAPGGRVLAGVFVEPSLSELRSLLQLEGPIDWRTAEEWREHLIGAGLRLVRHESSLRTFRYPSALGFLRSLHGVGAAPKRRVSPHRLRRLLREYGRFYGSAGGVRATWTFYRFEAERAG